MCPVVMAPAMHTEMWQHPATRANVATLRDRGVVVIDPAVGRLTGTDSGPGRLPEVRATSRPAPRCSLDRSRSGPRRAAGAGLGRRNPRAHRPGAVPRATGPAASRATRWPRRRPDAGAQVTLVSANVALPPPASVDVVRSGAPQTCTTRCATWPATADVVVMAAAVADFRPVGVSEVKLKKGPQPSPTEIKLERTADVLADLVAHRRPGQVIVGFAAETGDDERRRPEHGRASWPAKGCDLLVVNDVSGGQCVRAGTTTR